MVGVQLDMKATADVSQNNLIIKVIGSQILKHEWYDFVLAVQFR